MSLRTKSSGGASIPAIVAAHRLRNLIRSSTDSPVLETAGFLRRPEVILKHQKDSPTSDLDSFLGLFIFEVVNLCC